jgi:hypothetical protein
MDLDWKILISFDRVLNAPSYHYCCVSVRVSFLLSLFTLSVASVLKVAHLLCYAISSKSKASTYIGFVTCSAVI